MRQYTLKELRARKEWTQKEVADRLGISTQTYNSWEANFSKVKVGAARAIAQLYDVRLDQIKIK